MPIKEIKTVYVLGLGAIGGMYAAKISQTPGVTVKIIADRSRIATLQQEPFTVNGTPYTFDFILPGSEQPPADLIIIAVKYPGLKAGIKGIRSFVEENTVVISLLNGISSEDEIGREIGIEHVLPAYAVGMDAVRSGTEIQYSKPGKLVFGEAQNAKLSGRVESLKYLFESADIPYQIPTDMNRALWFKFMMNTGINQASAVLKAPYGVFQQQEEARKLMQLAASEVITLSRHCNINLDQSDLEEVFRIINTLDPAGKTSMLQDIEAGRKTEVELFAGKVIELGKKFNVPTPVNETLLGIILVMEKMQEPA